MTDSLKKSTGPSVLVSINQAETGTYGWFIIIRAANPAASKVLGYRASGVLETLRHLPETIDLQAEDADVSAWYTLHADHHPEIREQIRVLLEQSVRALLAAGDG